MQVCLGTSVFPRRNSKCPGILGEGGPRQVGVSETEHGPEAASHSSMAAVLPSECSLPDLRGQGHGVSAAELLRDAATTHT